MPVVAIRQLVSGLAPLRPELASAGCMPAKASNWSNSPKRQMSPISARKLAVQAGPTPSIVCSRRGALTPLPSTASVATKVGVATKQADKRQGAAGAGAAVSI